MSENDCQNPEEHCQLHVCQLKGTRTKPDIDKLYENPKFACANCGAKVNDERYLCNPKSI